MSEEKAISWEERFFRSKEAKYGVGTIFSRTNKVWIEGSIGKELCLKKDEAGRNFYETMICSRRKSGVEDVIPVIIPESKAFRLLDGKITDKYVEVGGEFHSLTVTGEDNLTHLHNFVFANCINVHNKSAVTEYVSDTNLIYLQGYVCKKPIFRYTALKRRKITELFIAVHTDDDVSHYIPCIAWKKDAILTRDVTIGSVIKFYGKIESRSYIKKFPNGEKEKRISYEISINEGLIEIEKRRNKF